MDLELGGRWAIIGASSGCLGLACAKALHADGVNVNQGAESTLALLSTLQHARCLVAS